MNPTAGAGPVGASSWRSDPVAWVLAALALALGGAWSAPANSWLDSAELTACAAELGNIHPPGHPAWLSLAPMVHLLPLGPFAWRVALFSALGAGLAVFVLVRLARGLLAGHVGPHAVSWLALASGLALLTSQSLWQVTVRAEVYTLALATNLLALHAAFCAGRVAGRLGTSLADTVAWVSLWGLAVCLGLLNHHYVAIFALPASLVAVAPALRQVARSRPRLVLWLLLGGAWLGLGYLSLGLRSHADTEMRWGNPGTLAGLWDTVTARHFQKSVTQVHVDVVANLVVLAGMVAEGMSLPVAALGLVGLALTVLLRDHQLGVLALALLGALLTKALMQIDTTNPDDHGYVLMAAAVFALGVGYMLAFVAGSRGLLAHLSAPVRLQIARVGAAVIAILCTAQAAELSATPAVHLTTLHAPDVLDAHLRTRLPPGAVYLANYYGLAFNEQAFRIAEGRRPDIVAMHLSLRTGDTDGGRAWQAWMSQRHPEWKSVMDGAAALGRAPVGNLLERAEHQPVWAEQDPEARIPPQFYGFEGVAQKLLPATDRAIDYNVADVLAKHQTVWSLLDTQLGAVADGPTRAVLLWQHAQQVAHALRRGWLTVARDELARAQVYSPTDRTLGYLQKRVDSLQAAYQSGDAAGFRALWQRWATLDFATLASDAP